MVKDNFNKGKLIKYWVEASDDDYETMLAMFKSKRYSWSLFIGHLMLEKLLKAYFVKVKSNYPPFIHNLLRLAEKSAMELTDHQKKDLLTITAFNINARYDNYKNSFKLKCTPNYTKEWVGKLKEIRIWMQKLIEQ